MATKECIEFINKQKIEGIANNLKWKRISKNKDEDKNEIRVFESSNLDTITIRQQYKNGELCIVEFFPAANLKCLDVLFQEKTDIKEKFFNNLDVLTDITTKSSKLFSSQT